MVIAFEFIHRYLRSTTRYFACRYRAGGNRAFFVESSAYHMLVPYNVQLGFFLLIYQGLRGQNYTQKEYHLKSTNLSLLHHLLMVAVCKNGGKKRVPDVRVRLFGGSYGTVSIALRYICCHAGNKRRRVGPACESRHTFITNLALAGVHPAIAQKLARYFSVELTMKYYIHVLHKSEMSAIESLKT